MARDMDFSARKRPQPIEVNKSLPATKNLNRAPSSTQLSVSGKKGSSLLVWLIIIVILALVGFVAWKYFKTGAVQQPASANNTNESSHEILSTNTLTSKNSLPTVQVYDSGSGEEAVTKLVSSLKSLGYSVDNLNKSQFNYDKTYIWYRTGLETEANKIQSTMPNRTTELKETKIAGSFDILIFLGTK